MRYRLIFLLNVKGKIKKWIFKDLGILKKNMTYSLGLMLISIGYSINTQADKIIVSKYFDLTTLGAYNTVFYLGSGLTLIVSAVGIAIFPQLTNLFKQKKIIEQKQLFLKLNLIFSILLSTLGSYLAVYSIEIIAIWTQDNEIAAILGYTSLFILLGSTFLAFQEIPYEFLLSMGITKYNNLFTLLSIIYTLTIMPLLLSRMGILGGGLSWILLMTFTTLIYLILIFKKFFLHWKLILVKTYFIPMFISLFFAFLSKYAIVKFTDNIYIVTITGIICGLLNIVIFYVVYRKYITNYQNKNHEKKLKYYEQEY